MLEDGPFDIFKSTSNSPLKKKKKKKSRSLNSQLNVPHITQPFVVTPSKSNLPDYEAFIGNENMKSFFQAGPHNFSRDLTINFKKKHQI